METYTYWRTVWLWPCFLLGTYNTILYDIVILYKIKQLMNKRIQ